MTELLSLSNTFLPVLYDLRLSINHTKPNFIGKLTVDVVSQKSSPFNLTLHASKLVLTKCYIETDLVIPLQVVYDRPNQTVTLSSEIELSEAKVVINYMGQINTISTYQDKTQGLFKTNYLDSISGKSNNYIIATHFQPFGARLCFPLIDELNSKVPIKLLVETLAKFKVASVGALSEVTAIESTANALFAFETTPPIAFSVFGFTIGDFDYIEKSVPLKSATIPCRIYTTLGDSDATTYALSLIETFLPIVEKIFNVDYPLAKLDFVTLPFLADGAMENWGLVTVLANQFLKPETFADRLRLQQLVAHELIHQWIGNLVTFDAWLNLWLNEAMATWIGNYVISVSNINKDVHTYNYNLDEISSYELFFDRDCFIDENEKLTIPSIHEQSASLNINKESSTSTIFNNDSYEKGIIFVGMVAKVLTYEKFFEGLSNLLNKYKHKTIKAYDIWNSLNEFSTADVLALAHSWIRYPGYPLLRVSFDKQLKFEQHIYLYNLQPDQVKLEDSPFHLPLQVQTTTKLLPIVLTDRSLELAIELEQLVVVNHERAGYYRTIYDETIVERSIIPNILNNKINRIDLITILNDYGKILSLKEELRSLLKIFEALTDSRWELDYTVLKVALSYLENIDNVLLHYSDYSFSGWLNTFASTLFERLSWEEATDNYNSHEYSVKNSILQLGLDNPNFQSIARRTFKLLGKSFTPREIIPSVFNLTIRKANQKEYKKILEFVKNSDQVKNSNITVQELQTIALSSLSFVLDDNLLSKSLNFILNNFDSKLIELGLVGVQFEGAKSRKLKIFQWYKIHYDAWVTKSSRTEQLLKTLYNISGIILGDLMQQDDLKGLRDSFIDEKKHLPAHGLIELVESLEDGIEQKRKIASYYGDLL